MVRFKIRLNIIRGITIINFTEKDFKNQKSSFKHEYDFDDDFNVEEYHSKKNFYKWFKGTEEYKNKTALSSLSKEYFDLKTKTFKKNEKHNKHDPYNKDNVICSRLLTRMNNYDYEIIKENEIIKEKRIKKTLKNNLELEKIIEESEIIFKFLNINKTNNIISRKLKKMQFAFSVIHSRVKNCDFIS